MIHDLDKSLLNLLEPMKSDGYVQEISFATPDDQFGPSLPAINLFLYDVRENNDLRSNEWRPELENDRPVGQRLPPVRVDCSYLVTAWAGDIAEEHHVLGQVMGLLVRYPKIPSDNLKGSLKNQELPLPATALQPGRLQSLGEFWQALGGKPKAAFYYTVTIAMPTQIIENEKPVGRVEERQLTVADRDWLTEEGVKQRGEKDSPPDWREPDKYFSDTRKAKFGKIRKIDKRERGES